MRVVIGVCLAIGLVACATEEPQMENRLELTLGGNNPSLRQDLARIDEARGYRPQRRPPAEVRPSPPGRQLPPPAQHPPRPRPSQPVTLKPVTLKEPVTRQAPVTLQAGETLYRLAVRHLGDGQRWREIARLNSWSEPQVSRLRAGTRVQLPLR